VGRTAEGRAIRRALRREENVILSGRYGMGRTRLVQHIAGDGSPPLQYVFVDFSGSVAETARELWIHIAGKKRSFVENLRFRVVVARLAAAAREKRNTVVVLDNIAELTLPKMRFLQQLTLFGKMRYIGIVEAFLPVEQLHRLKACLAPSVHVELKHLPLSEVCRYFEAVSKKYGRDWDSGMIRGMAAATGGYPLGMAKMAEAELKR
jgi:hypothetical protein